MPFGAKLFQFRRIIRRGLVIERTIEAQPRSWSQPIFESAPAIPIARQPLILAICPTSDPTAPAAPDTTTVSPGFGWQMFQKSEVSRHPRHGPARPAPSRPERASDRVWAGPHRLRPAYSCQPQYPRTKSPGASSLLRDSTTRPTVPPTIMSPTFTGSAYVLTPVIRPRM